MVYLGCPLGRFGFAPSGPVRFRYEWEKSHPGCWYWCGVCNVLEIKECHLVWSKLSNYRMLTLKNILKNQSLKKKWYGRLVHFDEISVQQHKSVLSRRMPNTCFYMFLTMSEHAPNDMMYGVLGDLSDLNQGITELLDRLRCNMVASDGLKHNVPQVFSWI